MCVGGVCSFLCTLTITHLGQKRTVDRKLACTVIASCFSVGSLDVLILYGPHRVEVRTPTESNDRGEESLPWLEQVAGKTRFFREESK